MTFCDTKSSSRTEAARAVRSPLGVPTPTRPSRSTNSSSTLSSAPSRLSPNYRLSTAPPATGSSTRKQRESAVRSVQLSVLQDGLDKREREVAEPNRQLEQREKNSSNDKPNYANRKTRKPHNLPTTPTSSQPSMPSPQKRPRKSRGLLLAPARKLRPGKAPKECSTQAGAARRHSQLPAACPCTSQRQSGTSPSLPAFPR